MARVVALVPRRPETWRDRLWAYVRERVEAEVDWPIIEGVDEGEQPMNRAAARNRAAEEAGDWDVAVFLDADTVPDFDNLRRAVDVARETGKLVCTQDVFRSLTREGTKAVLAGKCSIEEATKRWDYPQPKSSCIVLTRSTWDRVGGYDERFDGWGWEDSSIFHACQALVGVERLEGVCRHLWHPRSPEKNAGLDHYQANLDLGERYKAARKDPEAMRAILAEPGGPLAARGDSHRGGVVPAEGIAAMHRGEDIR